MKEILFKWTHDTSEIIANQKVDYFKNPDLCVKVLQNTSTPGIIFAPIFQMKKNNYYIIYIQGTSNRNNNSFIWIVNSNNKRLIKNYTFLDSEKDTTKTCFKAEKNDFFKVGVLVTSPKIDDYFVIKKLIIIEVNEEYMNHKSIECGPKKCDLKPDDYKSLNYDSDNYSGESLEDISQVSSIDYDNISIEENKNYDLITHTGNQTNYEYKKLFQLGELYLSDEVIEDIVFHSNIDLLDSYYYNSILPSGFTFFAQFIVHDITHNSPNSLLKRTYLKNKSSPFLDLDSVYGSISNKNFMFEQGKFIYNCDLHDLPRNSLGTPIIPDKRNDENYILAQFHLLWLMFHNKLFDYLKNNNKNLTNDELFTITRKEVTYHYQWIIMNDFLPRLIDNRLLDNIYNEGNKIYNIDKENLYIPLEFTVATMRYGHFTIKEQYQICDELYLNTPELLEYTKGKLPNKLINWTKFFKVVPDLPEPNPSKIINAQIQKDVNYMIATNYPEGLGTKKSLYLLDLKRSVQVGLTSGQKIAKHIGLEPLTLEQLKKYDYNNILGKHNLLQDTPLLIYILKESEIITNGTQLTGVGGRIVGEVIIGLIKKDENSYINNNWKPYLLEKEDFTIGDMINFIYN